MNQDYRSLAPCYDLATVWFLTEPRRALAAILAVEARSRSLSAPAAASISGEASLSGRIDAPSATLRTLDIGCGTGLQIMALRKAGLTASGIDHSPHMLERAKKNLGGSAGLTLGLASALPFADNSFDTAILSLLLHESGTAADGSPEAGRILREAARVAQRLLVLEWKMPERNLDYLVKLPVHCLERLAGRRHYRNFRRFMAAGGLEGLIYRHNLEAAPKLLVKERRILRLGALVLMDLRRD